MQLKIYKVMFIGIFLFSMIGVAWFNFHNNLEIIPTATPSITLTTTFIPQETRTSILIIPTKTIPAEKPTVIPSTGIIVFTCTYDGYNHICSINSDGSNLTRITKDAYHDYYPSLSPNSKTLIFVSNRTGTFNIFVQELNKNEPAKQLTNDLKDVSAPDISPDGKQVVFVAHDDGSASIWIMNIDGSNPRAITDSAWNEIDPRWSPDGKKISFAAMRGGYVQIFTMKPDGSDIKQVTEGNLRIGGRNSWSYDGKYITFYAGKQKDRDIYVVNVYDKTLTRLTSGGNNTGPCFSPDGKQIIFSSSRNGHHNLYVIDVDGRNMKQVTFRDDDDWQPIWGK